MTTLLVLQLLGFLVLLALSGFCSSSETSLFSLDPHEVHQMEEEDPVTAGRLRALLQQPTRLLSTILIGNTIVNVELWILGSSLLNAAGVRNETLQVAALTVVTLLFGELGPKRLATLHHKRLAALYCGPLSFLVRLLTPVRVMLEAVTGRFEHFFKPSGHVMTSDEYDTLVDEGGASGSLDPHEHTMVRAILQLESQTAGNVMTPRVDIEGIDVEDPDENLVKTACRAGVRYLVLYRRQLDDIVGFLDVRAFLLDPTRNLRSATRRPLYIPEQCTLDKLLTQFLANRSRVAVVVDEYGGTSGIITRGDILEELTGEMDTDDDDRLVFDQLTHRAWMIDGNMSLVEVARRTGLPFESETADRLAGWFTEKAERIPRVGEIVEGPNFKAMVRQMRRNRILLVLVERAEEAA